MNNAKMIDARGLSCPQPALMTQQAIKKMDKGFIEVLVDSGTARENVSRLARSTGWSVDIKDQSDGSCRIVLKK
jgi:tRNA 2-thiouridine synthesizing protein A